VLVLAACDCAFEVEYAHEEIGALVTAGFSGLIAPPGPFAGPVIGRYRIEPGDSRREYHVQCSRGGEPAATSRDDLVFYLDKSMTMALQCHRPDLYFLHAATVAIDDRAAVLAAPSGTGKSTLTCALLARRGMTYLSDELAPVSAERGVVYPYPHALCLKSRPPAPYRLPDSTLTTSSRFYVPVEALACAWHTSGVPVAAFFFLARASNADSRARAIGPAAAATQLFVNALNPLSHAGDGLDAAITLGQKIPSFQLDCGNLEAACDAVERVLRHRDVTTDRALR
jgi:hypothetical protein